MSKGQKITVWVISGLLTALFLYAGLFKLLMPDKVLSQGWFYARWFLTFIGVCETLGAIGLMIPRLAALAAAGLSVIMIGAVYTIVAHHLPALPVPIIVFFLLMLVIFLRRKEAKVQPA